MAKYHVNPQTGVPGVCSANNGRCPYGSAADHHDSPQAAVKAFEASFSAAVPQAQKKASSADMGAFQQAKAEFKQAEAHAKSLTVNTEERRQAYRDLNAKRTAMEAQQLELEKKGLGHLIPDDGNTIRVATVEQKVLLTEELMGQISDGMWENSGPQDHWEVWSGATVVVDPKHVGRNFNARKDNYQLNSSALLDIVGDRMVESVRAETGDQTFDNARMRQELAGLRKIFKTPRQSYTEADVANASGAAPAPAAKPAAKPAQAPSRPAPRSNVNHNDPARIRDALAGAGRSKPTDHYYGIMDQNRVNPATGDGDQYGHYQSGAVILGKADGSRLRIMAGGGEQYTDPEDNLGRRVTLTKQRHNSADGETRDLHVLGYVDSNGNKFGYVPDKKIHYFIFK